MAKLTCQEQNRNNVPPRALNTNLVIPRTSRGMTTGGFWRFGFDKMFVLCSLSFMSGAAPSMAERHALGLERLAEMTGKLVEVAYQRALLADVEPGEQERAMLLFDRLARGFRMTLALEARMDRDRRRDAAGLTVQVANPITASALPPPVAGPRPARAPREVEEERDADLEPSGLAAHIDDLRSLVADNADLLDPDGTHAAALDRWTDADGRAGGDARPAGAAAASRPESTQRRRSSPPDPRWRASG